MVSPYLGNILVCTHVHNNGNDQARKQLSWHTKFDHIFQVCYSYHNFLFSYTIKIKLYPYCIIYRKSFKTVRNQILYIEQEIFIMFVPIWLVCWPSDGHYIIDSKCICSYINYIADGAYGRTSTYACT